MLTILQGDWIEKLRTIPDGSVDCCVTSPPYYGLRDYGIPGQLGIEETPEKYTDKLVSGFREVRRVLSDSGTLWLNLGDSYAASGRGGGGNSFQHNAVGRQVSKANSLRSPRKGFKPKDLIGIPWMVAFALRADGWYLRSWAPWVKRNSMPESTQDRPVTSCETFFLLSKSERYYYDVESVKLPGSMELAQQVENGYNGKAKKAFEGTGAQDASAVKSRIIAGHRRTDKQRGHTRRHAGFNDRWDAMEKEWQCGGWRLTRNSDWFFESVAGLLLNEDSDPLAFVVNPKGFSGAHFATYPPELITPCILASCPPGGTVIDPFGGSGTTGKVALELGRKAILIELNPEYIKLIEERTTTTLGLPI